MKSINSLLLTVSAFIIVLTLFVAIPNAVHAQGPPGPPSILGCCQFQGACAETGLLECNNTLGSQGWFLGEMCNDITNECPGFNPPKNVPTMSQWGLVALAGVLGIIAFIGIRRKKQTA